MARQTIEEETPSRTASQRLSVNEDNQKKANITRRRQGVSHALNVDERVRLVRERREERERQLVSKELGWQVREERARRYHEEQLEERRRRLLEQRLKEERRRHAVEEKRKQKLKEEKERYESAVRRTMEKSQRAKQRLSQNCRGRKLIKNNAPCRLPLTSWEKKLVNRLLIPTCSYLARSKSAACQSQEEVSCHSVKADVAHKAQHHFGPAKHGTITSPTSNRTIHRTTTQAQKTNAKQMQGNEKKAYNSRPPQRASANSRAGPPTNPPNRSASPSQKQSQSKSVIRHFTPKQMELSTVPEEDFPENPTSLPPQNSQAVTTAGVYYQEDTEGNTLVNPYAYPYSPKPQIASMITNERFEAPPPAVTSRPSAGTTDPEEASRLLAEKRREARQQREKEEEERLRKEETERRGREELERRRAEVRAQQEAAAQCLLLERKRREEEEQRQAQSEEARKTMEEAALLQKERDEDLARLQERAEQLRLEREKVSQKEEAERQARKKRLEEIMRRTRKTDHDKKPAPTESLVKEAQPKENTKHVQSSRTEVVMQPSLLDSPGVEDMMPVVAFKERRSLRTLSGLEEIQAHHRAEVI